MDEASAQSLLGFLFVGMGWLHFVQRDREPTGRSFYLGGALLSPRARTVSAVAELATGCALLLTA